MDHQYIAASVIHDYLWVQAAESGASYSYANWVFRDALRASGVWWWRRQMMWLAVTANGWRVMAGRRQGRGRV